MRIGDRGVYIDSLQKAAVVEKQLRNADVRRTWHFRSVLWMTKTLCLIRCVQGSDIFPGDIPGVHGFFIVSASCIHLTILITGVYRRCCLVLRTV